MAGGTPVVAKEVRGFSIPDLVPVRMVNEFAYCPRLAYLEWVQGEFADNADTVQGRARHRRVDRERGGDDEQREQEGDDVVHARSLLLSAEKEGLIARMDIVEFEGKTATPVDYKRGKVPDIPERVWEPERVQLCAQGLILRENGFDCDEGIVYFVESKTRVTVRFDDELVERTRFLVAGLREMAAAGQMPPPLVDSPKCPRCSLVGICLPDETNLLKELDADDEAERVRVRRLIPKYPTLPGADKTGPRSGLLGSFPLTGTCSGEEECIRFAKRVKRYSGVRWTGLSHAVSRSFGSSASSVRQGHGDE